jgi:ribosomal protein S27AE
MDDYDLRTVEPTDENIIRLLGHPTISINPLQRRENPECPNCGRNHVLADCRLPHMEALLQRFGPQCLDTNTEAVEAKLKILVAIEKKAREEQ